jgi:hypothetical protein
MRKHGVVAVVLALLAATMAWAEEVVVGLRDVSAVRDGRGAARVLFRTGALAVTERMWVQSAILTVPYSGVSEDRVNELRVCPVTAARGAGGDWMTPFDEELYARADLDLRRGSGLMAFDLTVPLREILEEGLASDGFVLTAADRASGLRVQDLGRLSELGGATLRVTTTTLPSGPPPAEWLARRGIE